MPVLEHKIERFPFGVISSEEANKIPDGAASDSLNWLTKGSNIELVRGYQRLGKTENTGLASISGLIVGRRINSTQIPIRARGRKLEWYDSVADDWTEIGTNILGTTINTNDGEDMSMANYQHLAGAQVWVSSPNTGLIKIMTSHPADGEDNFAAARNHKGHIMTELGRMFLWNRGAQTASSLGGRAIDKNSVYLSKIDKDELSDYTQVTTENIGTGNGTTKTFSDTLADITGIRTAHNVIATDGTETFTDDGNGVLTGSLGGTGTINYNTGAISVTFNTAPTNLQAITSDYYYEDSTDGGIADFRKATPRVAGEGAVFPQHEGGALASVLSINDSQYCLHRNKTYKLTITGTDTGATNLVFRDKVGIPNLRAAVAVAEGIYYVDDQDENDVHLRLLTFIEGNTELLPQSVSKQFLIETTRVGIDLSNFRFDQAAMIEWGDYIVTACRHKDSARNNRLLMYHKKQGSIDILERFVRTLAIYNGTLIAGDSLSGNVYTLFSGVADDIGLIKNHWIGNISRLGIAYLKKAHRMILEGNIGPNQVVQIQLSLDRGAFVNIGSIRGDGSYVDKGQAVNVGSLTLGQGEVGGGSTGVTAFHFKREFKIHTDKFQEAQIKFVASENDQGNPVEPIGWASINLINFFDLRLKQQKVIERYR